MFVVALGTHLGLSLWSGHIHFSCPRTMSIDNLSVLGMKPVLHVRHSWAFGQCIVYEGDDEWFVIVVKDKGTSFWDLSGVLVWCRLTWAWGTPWIFSPMFFLPVQLSFTGVTSPVPCFIKCFIWVKQQCYVWMNHICKNSKHMYHGFCSACSNMNHPWWPSWPLKA